MRTEKELWKIIADNFDNFFSNKADRVNCICDCILVMGFPKYGILTYQERDFMLAKMRQIGVDEFGLPYSTMAPFWKYGDRESRKEFLKNKVNE